MRSELDDWLLGPAEGYLDSSRLLLIEADGVLQQIPFGALVTRKGDFLGQHFAMIASPGLAFWPYLRSEATFSFKDKALVVGNSLAAIDSGMRLPPLQDSETEARNVALNFTLPILLLGKDATGDKIKRELAVVRVFHFAGHAIASPARSGLLVAGSNITRAGEGSSYEFLDSSWINRQEMKKLDLVVLSACSTAGDDNGLADPQNLVRAFLRAGVPHVVASRWGVDSGSTELLMGQFYGDLNLGQSPAEALRNESAKARRTNKITNFRLDS